MNFGNSYQRTTPIVLNLIIINVLVYFAQMVFGGNEPLNKVNDLFALHHFKSSVFRPYQLVTHMFMHGGLFHLLFNMLALWMFGSVLERVWGPKRFLTFFLVCGVGAGLAQMGNYMYDFRHFDSGAYSFNPEEYDIMMRAGATVGASGAIMGVVAAFGYLFPNTQLFIMPIPFPVKAKWAILGIIALDVFGGITRAANDNIAHFAHVGGALIGFLIVLYWNKTKKQTFY
ncbi:MAG TPA: rhomboid family intramembrane serine protease [Chitinophagaceae bacterium]|nr:rhomboid family intramembrane serine protease [Chitinophagaceae bacterium]